MSEDTEKMQAAVVAALAEAGIEYTAKHVPTRYNTGKGERSYIAWRVQFKRGNLVLETDYRQGLGHLPRFELFAASGLSSKTLAAVEAIDRALQTGRGLAAETRNGKRMPVLCAACFLPQGPKIPAPHPADVVACLLLDMRIGLETFEDMCAELDENPDSRKAYATWEACRDTALRWMRVFPEAVTAKLRELLEGY